MGSLARMNWDVADVAPRLRGAGLDPTLWPEAMSAVCDAVGAFGAILISMDARFQDFPVTPSLAESAAAYVKHGWRVRSPRFRGAATLAARGFITDDDCVTREERDSSPFYQEFLRPHGLGEFFGLGFAVGGDLWCLSLQRRIGEPPFEIEAQRRILELWRPFADAATLSREFGGARAGGIVDGLENARQAAILFDGASRVLAMNGSAETLVGDLMDAASRTLAFHHRPSQANFLALLGRAIGGETTSELNPLAEVVLDRRGRKLIVRAIGLDGFARFGFANARALLLVREASLAPESLNFAALSRYGLTAAEARLAHEIADGASLAAIAERNSVSYETARSQLRAVFSKTNTHRQGELVALVANSRRAWRYA